NTENIQNAKGLDINGKNTVMLSYIPKLTDIDIMRSDLAAMQALELGQTVKALVEKNLEV
ncbi:hypothetical protein, partial [Clostridium haemolyticum]|uniref:hypothetical protein n=1 Tax=Clostridium haemolyticum TaxID=84025 RepID=UPI001300FF82